MRVLVIVPARGGSKGLPGKNVREVGGISLVGRAVRAAQAALRDLAGEARILLDTDSEEIAAEGRRHEAWVPFLRPATLAADDTPSMDNLLFALDRVAAAGGSPEWVVVLQPTSPLRSPADVRSCLDLAMRSGRSVVSVCPTEHPAEQTLRLDGDGTLRWAWPAARPESRRQDLPIGHRPNGAVYVASTETLRRRRTFFVEGETLGWEMPPERSIDVDGASDLAIAESLLGMAQATAIRIGTRDVGPGRPCFIIAEAGVNHDGDVARAHQLVDLAADAGADAVKFQTFEPDKLAAADAAMAAYQVANTGKRESQADMLRRLVLPHEAHRALQRHAEDRGLVFLSTPFDEASADFLEELGVPAFKIGSGELTNHRLLAHVAKKGRPMLISTGMADLAEVLDAVGVVQRAGCSEAAVFHCVTSYPALPSDANLRAMDTLRSALGVPVGWSDHTPGVTISVAAVARGAALIEKHFTTDRSLPGPDHKASLSPEEIVAMVRAIREVEQSLGDGRKVPRPVELPIRPDSRRSVHAARDLPVGKVLTDEDLVALRPGTGMSAARLPALVGRMVARPVRAGQRFAEEDLV
jgi:N,N'-diacetyllegionaminate synthase